MRRNSSGACTPECLCRGSVCLRFAQAHRLKDMTYCYQLHRPYLALPPSNPSSSPLRLPSNLLLSPLPCLHLVLHVHHHCLATSITWTTLQHSSPALSQPPFQKYFKIFKLARGCHKSRNLKPSSTIERYRKGSVSHFCEDIWQKSIPLVEAKTYILWSKLIKRAALRQWAMPCQQEGARSGKVRCVKQMKESCLGEPQSSDLTLWVVNWCDGTFVHCLVIFSSSSSSSSPPPPPPCTQKSFSTVPAACEEDCIVGRRSTELTGLSHSGRTCIQVLIVDGVLLLPFCLEGASGRWPQDEPYRTWFDSKKRWNRTRTLVPHAFWAWSSSMNKQTCKTKPSCVLVPMLFKEHTPFDSRSCVPVACAVTSST